MMIFRLNKNIVLLFIIYCFSCGRTSPKKILKLAHGLDTNHPVHKAMVFMADDIKNKSNGMLSIQIYPNQQLGSERQCLELLQIGGLDMTKVSTAVMENFVPDMKILGLPFLFKNKAHQFRVLDGKIGQDLLAGSEKFWLKGLAYYDAGSRSFYTKKSSIRSPKDLEGLKIRVMESATAVDMVNYLGSNATPISSGEVYTALQQGVVDGAENNPPSFYFSKHYEVCKYYSLDQHSSIPDMLVISTHSWKRMSPQHQKWLKESVALSVVRQRTLWQSKEEDVLKKLVKEGVLITKPDPQSFRKKVLPMYLVYKEKKPRLYKLIQKIQKDEQD